MPSRKPPSSSSSAYIRQHRSQDSVAAPSSNASSTAVPTNPSLHTADPGSSHQQKIIKVLVQRLGTKLPSNSGASLVQVEADHTVEETIQCLVELSRDSLDIIAIALTDLLEKITKPADIRIDILQSQLFVLKVLSICMASRSGRPLVDNCAIYVLAVMVIFLRQTAPPEGRLMSSANLSFEATFHDFESIEVDDSPGQAQGQGEGGLFDHIHFLTNGTPTTRRPLAGSVSSAPSSGPASAIPSPPAAATAAHPAPTLPQHSTRFERTHKSLARSHFSLNALILKFAGRIVYHLSASNWPVVLSKIQVKIRQLAGPADAENLDVVDLFLMKHSSLNRVRLHQLLQEMASLLVNMSLEAKIALAVPLRTALWNWIDLFPGEFHDALRSHRRLDGAPERVFDNLWEVGVGATDLAAARALWPTLAVLSIVSPERTVPDYYQLNPKSSAARFMGALQKAISPGASNPKLRDVAIVCLLDICRGAARVRLADDTVPVRQLAADIAHDVRTLLLKYEGGQRPFWEGADEIDVAMFADALVAVFRFSRADEAMPLFETCLEPDRSDAVKLVAIKACITLAVEARTIQRQPDLSALARMVAPRTRSIFRYGGTRRNEVDRNGTLRRSAGRPKAKKFTAEVVSDRELLAIAILHAWKTHGAFLFTGLGADEAREFIPASLAVWEQQADTSIQYSIALAFNQVAMQVHGIPRDDPLYESAVLWKLLSTPAAVHTVANALLASRMEPDKQRMWAEVGHVYALVYGTPPGAADTILSQLQADPARVPALALLEIAMAVSLASADQQVSHLAAHTLRTLAISERAPGAPVNSTLSEDDRGRRYPIYEQIGDPKVRVTGRRAWQKWIRRLYSTLANPHPFFVAVWEECYYRWCALTELVIRAPIDGLEVEDAGRPTGDRTWTIEEQRNQWQNLTLFLAACGSACLGEAHNPQALQASIAAELLPDGMRVQKDPRELVTNFIQYLIDLLLTDSVMARETAKEALGSELSWRLHGRLLKHLDDVIQDITRGENMEWSVQFGVFLDQFIAVLKLLSENTQATDELLTADVTPTLHALAGFINRFTGDPEACRVRVKFCALCDSLFARPDMLSMRKEGNLRQQVLDVLIDWIQNPENGEDEEAVRTQQEVNIASLRAATHFLDRLELRSLDNTGGQDEVGHVASRLFKRYADAIMRPLEFVRLPADDGASEMSLNSAKARTSEVALEVRELVVKGLARLISANTESGVKYSLLMAYDADIGKRVIFAKVFARVMGEGTKLDAPEASAPVVARSRLGEMIKGPDITIALAICETCPSSEVDVIIPVLLNIFDTRQSLMQLMKALVDREMARTENEAELFRGNSTCTRLLSAFAKTHGYSYLHSLIAPLVKTMEESPPGTRYELDPAKTTKEEREQNQKNVELVASTFLRIITESVTSLPSMFRELCSHIGKAVNNYWPEAKFAALGAFIFLRFISPAVVSPDLVDVEVPKNNDIVIKKGLMTVAKIIQNLANNIFFGKEQHLVPLNPFLEENIVNVTRFLSELNRWTIGVDTPDPDEWVGTAFDDTDTIVLHRFFDKHADKVGKELLSVAKPAADGAGDANAVNGKRAWDAICAALVELGQPIEVPKPSMLNSTQHSAYLELMDKYRRRSTAAVKDLFVETYTSKDQTAIFILFVSKMDVETLDIDLLLYHVFKTLSSPDYADRHFSIIFDWTSFSSTSQIPMQWLKYCIEMVPSDIRTRFDTAYGLNLNAAGHQYMRRVYKVTAGLQLSHNVKACSSIEELLQYVPATCVGPLVYAKGLEVEPVEQYIRIMMRQHHSLRTPVTIEVGATHLRVISDKAQPISPSVSCKPVEIIPFAEISDVYNVSSAHDPSEFIVRKTRQASTLYFSTPQRDLIVKAIRGAKGRMRSSTLPGTERFSRLSNVSAALLHIALLNLGAENVELRASSYELLFSVIASFDLDNNPTLSSKGVWQGCSAAVIPGLSSKIATAVPHLTLDFISEVCGTIEKADPSLRLHCISYMAPWLKNLPYFVDPTSACYDPSGAKLRDSIRSLIDLTLSDQSMVMVAQKTIWSEISQLDTSVVNVILDELMRAAIDGGVLSQRCETICQIMLPLSSINVRGQILSKMRKALGKTSVKPTRNLADNTHWNEIASLSRLALVAGQQGKQPNINIPQFYLPELVHLVTLIAATGETLVRTTIWALVMDALQALWSSRSTDPIAGPEIQQLHDEASTEETLKFFGLTRAPFTGDLIAFTPKDEKGVLDNQEGIVTFLMRVMESAAQTKGLLNVWRARWMSLVTATAFQVSPAVQARAFIVLGALATSDVDDDFFYQMLVSLKTGLMQFSESDTIPVVSMLRCIRNIVPALLPNSRYLPQVFWLAVALLQSSHIALYLEAAHLLRVTTETLHAQGYFVEQSMAAMLLEHRVPLEDIATQLDQLLGLVFDVSFSFSLAAIIFKGMRLGFLRGTAVDTLRALLRVSSRTPSDANDDEGPRTAIHPDALGFFLALLPASTDPATFKDLLADANLDVEANFQPTEDQRVPRIPLHALGISDHDTALYVVSFLRTMIMSTPGDDSETEILFCVLSDVATAFPDVLALTYDGLKDKIKETFSTSSNPAVLNAASYIFHIALQDPKLAFGQSSASLSTVEEGTTVNGLGRGHLSALEELRMNGLATPVNFVTSQKPHAATKVINWISELVVRMIE